MSDQPNAAAAKGKKGGAAAGPLPPIVAKAQYIKDLSFEAPAAPGVFALLANRQPDISINLDVQVSPVPDGSFDVALHVKINCKVGDMTGFVLELAYAGLFALNVPEEHRQPVLLIECPRLLFPFVRQIIADVSRDGGFPPLMLAPVDFAGLYHQKLMEQQAASAGGNA